MFETAYPVSLLIFLMGVLVALSISLKSVFHRFLLAPIAGFIALGWGLRFFEAKGNYLPMGAEEILAFLGEIGIVTILFRVGMECHPKGLVKQITRGGVLAVTNIFLSGILGFVVPFYLFHLSSISSLFIAVALTATSLGVVIAIWREEGIIDTKEGQLLLDMTAIDDIIALFLLTFLIHVADLNLKGIMAFFFLKLVLFVGACYLFAHFLERKIMCLLEKFEMNPDPIITIVSIGFMIAGIAGLLGFSLVLGAFFAGLVFSKDPEAIKMGEPIRSLEAFFAPFFFIGIGFQVFPGAFEEGLWLGVALIIVGCLGKYLGVWIPARLMGMKKASLLGVSMIARAEIALVVMTVGLRSQAVTQHTYASVVMVSFVTCLLAPILIKCANGKVDAQN